MSLIPRASFTSMVPALLTIGLAGVVPVYGAAMEAAPASVHAADGSLAALLAQVDLEAMRADQGFADWSREDRIRDLADCMRKAGQPEAEISRVMASMSASLGGSSNGLLAQLLGDEFFYVLYLYVYCHNKFVKLCCGCKFKENMFLAEWCTKLQGLTVDNSSRSFSTRTQDVSSNTSGSGCSSCGGAGDVAGTGVGGLEMSRITSFRDSTQRASFAPGMFLCHDVALTVAAIDSTTQAPTKLRFYDPGLQFGNDLVPKVGATGVFVESFFTTFRDVTLYASYDLSSGAGVVVAPGYRMRDVAYAVMTRNDGSRVVYEVANTDLRQGLWIDATSGVSALPSGTVNGFGIGIVNFGSSKAARFDRIELLDGAGTSFYREIMPSDASGSNADLLANGWGFISDGVTSTQGIIQKTSAAETMTALNSSPVGAYSGFAYYLQSAQGNQAFVTSEYAGFPVSQLAKMRFSTAHQSASSLDNRAMVKVGSQWYISATGPRQVSSNTWEDKELDLAGVGVWYKAELRTSKSNYQPRAVAFLDRNGYGTRLSYPAVIGNSGNANYLKFSTITDAHGSAAQVTWNASQVGGQNVISAIQMPNGQTISYQYSGGFLSGVQYPDGTSANFTRGTEASFTTVSVFDPRAPGDARRYTAYLSNITGTGFTGPMSALRTEKLKNGAGEWMYWFLNMGIDGAEPVSLVYEGGNRLKEVSPKGTRYVPNFTYTPSSTNALVSLSQVTYGLEATNETRTYSDWQRQQISQVVTDSGVTYQQTWTPSGQPLTIKRVGDSATSSTTYNQFDQPLVHIDELGRVSEYVYDARGNLLSMTEAKGTADEATTTRIYYPAGHQNQFLLQEERTARYDAAAPDLHSTRYVYNANQQLIQRIEAADVSGGARLIKLEDVGNAAGQPDLLTRLTAAK